MRIDNSSNRRRKKEKQRREQSIMEKEINMSEITAKMPWAGHTGNIPLTLEYFEGTMYEKVEEIAKRYPKYTAFDFRNY